MTDFSTALRWVLRNEGTTYVNDANDLGGPTRYGITQATLSEYRRHLATAEDVAQLTYDEASHIYLTRYWLPIHGGDIEDPLACIGIFDAAVLCGVGSAVMFAQEAYGTPVDGKMGYRTLSAINGFRGRMEPVLRFIDTYQEHLVRQVLRRPANLGFLVSWLSRTSRLYHAAAMGTIEC